jgi:membrane peptidoglycan carboxypeptidase
MLRLSRSPLRLVSIALVAVLTIESALFISAYSTAYEYVRQHDARKSGSINGPLVFARPKMLAVGQSIMRDEVVRHLASIGYQAREGTDAGTFSVTDSRLQINSRLPEFPNTTITFERRRVAAITVGGQPVERVEVEPPQLVSFVRLVRDDVARSMRVRRIALQQADLIPSALYDAVRSSEDFRFEWHNGIDELGMIRGLFTGGGGSTLTQQLMKNVVLADQSRTYSRKLKDSMLALAAERQMSKQEIFAAYSNNCYMGTIPGGPAIWGFGAAAQELFNTTDIRSLSAGRAATLAAMLNKPEAYLRAAREGDYSELLKRRERVLNLMRRNYPERYSEEMIAQAKAEPLVFQLTNGREREQPLDIVSRQFQDYAASQAQELLGLTQAQDNLHIFTTVEPELQIAAHKSVTEQLSRLDQMVAALCRGQGIDPASVEPIQAAVVAMDARTGEILAMVGNRNGEYNFATSERSPGSADKPFVYLKAIESGKHDGAPFTAATWLDPQNDPVDNYRPRQHVGSPGRARSLLARSDNGGAVVTAHDAGLSRVRDFIRTLTGSFSHELTGMLAIGGSAGTDVSLVNLVEGYTVFPTGGLKATQTPFTSLYRDGVRLNVPHSAPLRVTDSASAYVVSDMLRSVMQSGGTAAGLPWGDLRNYNLALKTGTGQVADCWMIGFSPHGLVVGVWVGMPKNKPTLTMAEGFDGAHIAGPIWLAFMQAVLQHRPDLLQGDFPRPANVKVLRVDPNRGCISDGPGMDENFIQGREPLPCSSR